MLTNSITNPVTADGDYEFNFAGRPGSSLILEVSGTFGAATVTLFWKDSSGTKQDLLLTSEAVTTTAPDYFTVTTPLSGLVGFEVSGADGATSLTLSAGVSK